jgi:hypothetical protein
MLHPKVIEFLAACKQDPLLYVMGAFPWESDLSIQKVPLPEKYKERFPNSNWGPDEWQCDFLTQLGEDIKARGFNGRAPVAAIRNSVVSGHGTGKSTLTAWLTKFILDTRPYSVGTVTANTAPQLRTKTWAEVGKWHNISATKDMFKYTLSSNQMSLVHIDPELAARWKCFAHTCDPSNSESFAGQHSDATSFYIFDEASKIEDVLFDVREGGLKGGEPMVFDFGNGTRNSGRFKENCVGKYRHQYRVWSVDSRDVHRTNKEELQREVKEFGEDSDYVRVRIRGLFPKQASAQLIPNDKVEEAQARLVPPYNKAAPLYIGVDVALQGADSTVIYPRLGNDARSYPPRQFRGLDPEQIANEVKQYVVEFRQLGLSPAGIFIDGGGGYGSGVFTHLRQMGIHATLIYPGRSALKSKDFGNRITEMWAEMAKSIASDLCLPDGGTRIGKELAEELTEREALPTLSGQLRLVSKEKLAKSPDIADSLALTFARETLAGAGQGGAVAVKFYHDDED